MALPQNREIDLAEAGGSVSMQKRVAEKLIHTVHCGSWIGARGTISGTPTATIAPSGAQAPTATVGAPTNNKFDVTVDAGDPAWNTSGQGTIDLLIAFSNGEKAKLTLNYKIVA